MTNQNINKRVLARSIRVINNETNIFRHTLREEILADLADGPKFRQNPPNLLPAKFDFFYNPPKLIPAKFNIFLDLPKLIPAKYKNFHQPPKFLPLRYCLPFINSNLRT